jgi:2-polyprenyl-3-methyl-5-hydroxy-6-metoxy-1,4-benzoquinol methylase
VVRSDYNLTGATETVYQAVECADCRFRYLDPRPAPEQLAAHYAADYPAHALEWRPDATLTAEQASLNRRFERITLHRLALVQQHVPPRTPLRVLDVGCGNGAFLLGLLRWGDVEAWGLDIAESALIALGRKDNRLQLRVGDLHTTELPDGYFDLITLWHALEHDGDPVGVLRRAGELLRAGGCVMAEVPNSGGLLARLCGRHWLGWDLPRHLVHFSAATLRQAALRAELDQVRVHREYTLNPLTLSPVLASAALWARRRRGRKRMRGPTYHRWDGMGDVVLRLINGMERFLGGNGLLLTARAPLEGRSRCAA